MTDTELEAYVVQLRNSMKGVGTDEDILIKLTSEHKLKTRLKMKSQYKSTYGRDLLDDFKSELSGYFLELMLGLYTDIYEYDAEECHKALEGLGTNEETLIDIIGTRPGWMLKKIKEEYKEKYKVELEEDIKKETTGDFQKLLISLLACSRSDNKNPDKEKCSQIAKELYNAGEKKLGTEEEIFNKYIGTCSPPELMAIAREYHKEYGKSLMVAIDKEFSGDICQLIKTIFYANISPSEYFATRIKDAVAGAGTEEKILNRVIVARNEIDMALIKQYYKLLYQKDLVEDIKGDTSGSYKNLLVEMINK
jgi:annexin A7/11